MKFARYMYEKYIDGKIMSVVKVGGKSSRYRGIKADFNRILV